MKKRFVVAVVAGGLLAAMLPGAATAQGSSSVDASTSVIPAPDYVWDGRLATEVDYVWDGRLATEGDYVWDGRLATEVVYVWDGRLATDVTRDYVWDRRLTTVKA